MTEKLSTSLARQAVGIRELVSFMEYDRGYIDLEEKALQPLKDSIISRSLENIVFGGADGIRTHDLLDAIEARSQLRHGPTDLKHK